MTFFDTVEKLFRDWNYGHPKVLYGLIRSLRPAVVVEVGAYRGYGSAYMAKAIQDNNHGHLYCIDNLQLSHTEMREDPARHWHENLSACGVRDWATLLVGDSDKVKWPGRVDFAYIDGWHSYAQTRKDFEACASRGAECITLDDVWKCVGPRQLLNEIRASGEWDVVEIRRDNGLGICYRRSPAGPVTFSQEDPHHQGYDIHDVAAMRAHLIDIDKRFGVTYDLDKLLK
jgi:hypothetical protein